MAQWVNLNRNNISMIVHQYSTSLEKAGPVLEGSPTPQKGYADFEICRIYPDFTDFKRFPEISQISWDFTAKT